MKTFRELDQVIVDWFDIPLTKFQEKYNIEDQSFREAVGFVRGICFALEREFKLYNE